MDRITKSLLDEFSNENGIGPLPEDRRFEHFAAYLCVSRHFGETFDTEDVVTASGGDTGIDAIAVLVNGALVTDPELVAELAETNSLVDATFIFVQAERSSSFETSKIGQFGFGARDFFSEKPTLARNDRVTALSEVMNAVFSRSSKFKRGNPACKLFYVTTGKWVGDMNLEARRKAVVEDLEEGRLFREVEFLPVDADTIQKLYNQTRNAVSRDFTFSERTVVPEIPGVKEAYLGLLPATEFITLLDDGTGGILKSIFYDNVRDWQEYNPVNAEIRATIEDQAQRARFSIMNNGVTIIAKTLRATGNRFHIEDYQVVNGCQTSHVLFENRQRLDASVVVPLRLIATDDEEVAAAIVKATNRQTEVKEEQLLALSDFQKKVEAYFQTFAEPRKLFYERRSRQYGASAVEKTRIVTPTNLIRAYASIFFGEPHRTTRSYRLLLQQLGKTIFGPQDRPEPYYYAASSLYRLEFLFRNGVLQSKYKPARYHVLYAAHRLLTPERAPRANAHEMARYCEPLVDIMWDPDKAAEVFVRAAKIVEDAAAGDFGRDQVRTEPFTEEVSRRCDAERHRPASA
jgi:hypothetical protein